MKGVEDTKEVARPLLWATNNSKSNSDSALTKCDILLGVL